MTVAEDRSSLVTDPGMAAAGTMNIAGSSLAAGPEFEPLEGPSREIVPHTVSNLGCMSTDPEMPTSGIGHNLQPKTKLDTLRALSRCSNLVDLGIVLAWGYKAGLICFNDRAAPTQAPRRKRGSLFPLPVPLPESAHWDLAGIPPGERLDLGVDCWVGLGCVAINRLYGHPNVGPSRPSGKVHEAVVASLRDRVSRFLAGDKVAPFSFDDAVKDLKEKRLSYSGEEIQQPHAISCEQILQGLPPPGHGGSIPLLPFLKGRTRYLMENPLESLLAEKDRASGPVTAKVHIVKGEEVKVFNLLHSRGVINWIKAGDAFSDSRGTYLSGLFGVIKPGKTTSTGKPVLRVIMNLIPSNSLFDIIQGDISLLPSATQWMPLCVSDGEEISLSQSDMSAAFYLFSIPHCWQPYMVFNFRAKGCEVGLDGLDPDGWYRPTCRALPMGWASSVGLMQAVSREILLSRGLPPQLELKKTGLIPSWFTKVAEASTPQRMWWQVYLDNFMSGHVGNPGDLGGDVGLQEKAMHAWESAGVLTAKDKQVVGVHCATELGVRIDGVLGLLGGSPERVLKTVYVTLHHLANAWWSKKEAQVVLGRWIFLLQYRRAAMGVLSRSWQVLEMPWPSVLHIGCVHAELLQLVFMAPLIQTDLRSTFDGEVTCSDASESGGACARSLGLTWSGQSLVGSLSDLRLRGLERPILVVSLFNGIGGAFRLYDVLGIIPQGRISVEIYRPANRVTRTTWPNVIELHDVEHIDLAEIKRWAALFPHIQELHLYAGFPCVHLSSVRAYRRNLDGEGSRLFWRLLEILGMVEEVFSVYCKVKYCIENVASMDEDARMAISDELKICPIKLDPADVLPNSRPRFAWSSEPLYEMEGLTLWKEKEYVRAYATSMAVETEQWIRPGWRWEAPQGTCFPTFMKAIRREKPPPQPAGLSRTTAQTQQRWAEDQFRYPPYQYKDQFLVTHSVQPARLLDSSERELLLGFGPGHTASCLSASEAKRSYRDYEDIRCSLCGDSFSVASFAIIASSLCAELAPRMSPAQIVSRLGLAPGATIHPSVAVPLTRKLAYGGNPLVEHDPVELVKQLGLSVNNTGADVRIATGELMGGKSGAHASARAWWWQWKHLFKVKWLFSSHINFLEMKMILLSILWKSRSPGNFNKRWLHLEDSLVCLFILTKGRTSSQLLQPLTNQIGAVQLATGSTLLHGHVGSAENPTDRASRE